METENDEVFTQVTTAQHVLIAKILQSSKLSDKEYRMLNNFVNSKVVTRYDASILIDFVLATLKFRRHFLSAACRAYKKCNFCSSRDNVLRYANAEDLNKRIWICASCALNLPDKVVPVPKAQNA